MMIMTENVPNRPHSLMKISSDDGEKKENVPDTLGVMQNRLTDLPALMMVRGNRMFQIVLMV